MARVVGVLGGMGPLATAHFLTKLVMSTPVHSEGDHLPTVTWSNPSVPDRTRALLKTGPSPVPAMQEGVERLAALGADILAIPCNTAHAFVSAIDIPPGLEFVSMIEATRRTVTEVLDVGNPSAQVGVLATEGTRAAALYERALEPDGVSVLNVRVRTQQRCVNAAIRLVKTGTSYDLAADLISEAAGELVEQGAQMILAACSEIPLVLDGGAAEVPVIDSVQCLADEVVRRARAMTTPAAHAR